MLNDYRILLLLLIPIISTVLSLYYFRREFNLLEGIASLILFTVLLIPMWYWGRDTRINAFNEQIGGFVNSHYTEDGDHEESYRCNCRTDSDGNTSCDTCWRTVYHRDFIVTNTTGDWWEGSRWSDRVDKPCRDCEPYHIPEYFLETYIGKPVSLDHGYPNYIGAMNESLYRNTYQGVASFLPDICPESPDIRVSNTSVYRIIPVGFPPESPLRSVIYSWNFVGTPVDLNTLNESSVPLYGDSMFGFLGSEVQGDIHLYIFNSPSMNYAEMCLAKWKNGAKNSINVFIFGDSDGVGYSVRDVYVGLGVDGARKNSELQFTNDSERSNYYMKFDIRNQLLDYFQNGGTLDREKVLRIIFDNVYQKFVRQEMSEFQSLKNYVYPTSGFMIFIAVVMIILEVGMKFYFISNEF